jgi:importin subunit alpha-6/7
LAGDEDLQKRSILKHQPLPALRDLLASGDFFLADGACEAVTSIMALGQTHIETVIQHQIIPLLVDMLAWDHDDDASDRVVKAFGAATANGSRDQIRILVGNGCIRPLCEFLRQDFDRVLGVFEVLESILRAGADSRGANPMAAEVVEAGGLVKLQALRGHFGAAAILQTYFGDEEESGPESESDESGKPNGDDDDEQESGAESESDESGKPNGDNDDEQESGAESESDADEVEDEENAEPPRQRPRIA